MTYGFIRFKNTTQAAMAIEMFDNYKIENHRLSVKFGRANRENGDERPKSTVGINSVVEDDDWETVDRNSIPPKSRLPSRNSTSESLSKSQNFDIDFNTPFDMSKPYARRLVEEYLKKIDDFNERHGQKKACISPMEPAKGKFFYFKLN
jgi:RNA recognition motif-containing protein